MIGRGGNSESANGLAGSGPSTPYRADEAGSHLPSGQQTYHREQNHAACIREAPTRGTCHSQRCVCGQLCSFSFLPSSPSLYCTLKKLKRKFSNSPGKFKGPLGGTTKAGEARQTIAEMAAQLLELEGEHIEVVQSTAAAGKRGIISDAELDMLLDRRKEVFEGRRVGWKSGASARRGGGSGAGAGKDASSDEPAAASTGRGGAGDGLFEVYEAPVDEGNDALAHMLGEDVAV